MSVHHHLRVDTGAPGVTRGLQVALTARGNDVELLSFSDFPDRVPHQVCSLVFPAWLVANMERRRRRGAVPDLWDASTADAWLWGRYLKPRRTTALVTRSHGLEHVAHDIRLVAAREGSIKLRRRYGLYWGGAHLHEVAESLRTADACVMLSEKDRHLAVERLGVAEDRVHVVSNALEDVFLLQPEPRPRTGPLRIVQIGSYTFIKGVQYGTPALVAALRRFPELGVSLVGVGVPADRVLADFPTELWPRVEVVERYRNSDLPELLAGHDIVIAPSLSEGFGIALLEAMACGLAPVATDTPGPGRFVTSGVNGLLVPPQDAAALTAALVTLIQDAPMRADFARRSWERARTFGWDRTVRENLAAYDAALTVAGRRRARR